MGFVTPVSDLEIKHAIAARIKTAAPKALVVERWLEQMGSGKFAGLLRSPDDLDEAGNERIHAYLITRRSMSCAFAGEIPWFSDLAVGPMRLDMSSTYEVWGWRGYEQGTDQQNSEDDFQAEIDAVTFELAAYPKLQNGEIVKSHSGITWEDVATIPMGSDYCWLARGKVTVDWWASVEMKG